VAYAVVDEDRSSESRDLLARFAGSHNFSLLAELESVDQIDDAIDPMDVRLVLRVGPDFAERLHGGRPAELQVVLDGRNSNVAGIAAGYVQTIVGQWNAERARAGRGPTVEVVRRAWYNPTLDSRWFIVSGLPAQLALVVVMLLTSLSVAREREQGTFDQTLVAPIGSVQILVGKSVPAFAFGLLDGLLLSAGAVAWFGVPMTGSLPALVAVLSVYAVAILGIGLFISSLAATMQQGLLGSFVFLMPAVILSGFTTPIENMPGWLQHATVANPARYAVAGCRAVFLEGASVAEVARYLVPMSIVAAVCLSAATWLFRTRTR
jgi:ABC-2 type transport system permease protein